MGVQSWVLFLAMVISAATLTQCEGEDPEDPSEPTSCSATGFTKIQASMDVCMTCHADPADPDNMPTLSEEATAADNAKALQAAGWRNGGTLHDYITGKEEHEGDEHDGAGAAADIPRSDYTPWCVE